MQGILRCKKSTLGLEHWVVETGGATASGHDTWKSARQDGTEAREDPETGAVFYHHVSSGKIQWENLLK
ncbi:hypothetical protein ACS0TY_032219 [Phlomoides rotata]